MVARRDHLSLSTYWNCGFANQRIIVFLVCSIGGALTDTLDDLITQNNIDPQLAMKVLANFDRAIAEVLQDKVRSRLTFKVSIDYRRWGVVIDVLDLGASADTCVSLRPCRQASIRTGSATKSGLSS